MKHVSRIRFMALAAAVLTATIVAGCSSAPLRTEASTSGIRAAEVAGAASVPQASLHLQLAQDELAKARELSEKGEKDKAASMLMRAEADAELALVLAQGDAEKTEANEAVARVRKLRQENP
ncbi:MAG: hypothetical protein R6W75_06440 [Smithellaceae bacterium]